MPRGQARTSWAFPLLLPSIPAADEEISLEIPANILEGSQRAHVTVMGKGQVGNEALRGAGRVQSSVAQAQQEVGPPGAEMGGDTGDTANDGAPRIPLGQVTSWATLCRTWTASWPCPTAAGSRTWSASPPTSTSSSTWRRAGSCAPTSAPRRRASCRAVSVPGPLSRPHALPCCPGTPPPHLPPLHSLLASRGGSGLHPASTIPRGCKDLHVKTHPHPLPTGYQRELLYKHDDGSYSAFGKSDSSGNTW